MSSLYPSTKLSYPAEAFQYASSSPPEILNVIFNHLTLASPAGDLGLDLISCSLVCLSWHHVAIGMLPASAHKVNLAIPRFYSLNDVERLKDLVCETRRLRLNTFDHVRGMRFYLPQLFRPNSGRRQMHRSVAFDVGRGQLVMTRLLKSLGGNLNALAFDYDSFDYNYSNMPFYDQELSPSLVRHCWNVSRLELNGMDRNSVRSATPPIAPIVAELRDVLQSVRLDGVGINRSLINALQQCQHITEAQFTGDPGIISQSLVDLASSWRNLEILHVSILTVYSDTASDFLPVIAESCPRLHTMEFSNNLIPLFHPSDHSLEILLRKCKQLRHLALGFSVNITGLSLANAFLHGASLVHLSLGNCPNLSVVPVDEAQICAPCLKTIDLVGCTELSLPVVEPMVRACPSLERVTLPDDVRDLEDVSEALRLRGFEFMGDEDVKLWVWARVVLEM
ncbi:hypothetical protein BC938DRAFT_482643 [Jimgerdemannia flammicorona]|uniref:F-box domain-containing protein n=1 Tax=Jimgerdemannia flammicorona TaxID=994334 RepID=A0A433QDG6_9FUNG|nr:hypothetical protein BC938DRAFT_482643 [Jimgerdemannia flammicorona]